MNYCIAPSGLRVRSVNDTSMDLDWDGLNCTESHGVISGYVIQYMAIDPDTAPITIADIHAESYGLSSLSPCTNHSIRVAAVNKEGNKSTFSGPVFATTDPEHGKSKYKFYMRKNFFKK